MTIKVAPSTFHTLKFISENPGCTSSEFNNNFGRDLCHIRSPYYSNMLSLDIEGSQPHPRSAAGRKISMAMKYWSRCNANPEEYLRVDPPPSLEDIFEWARGRRNWIYRSKTNSKVFRYYLTNKGMSIIDELECERGGHRFPLRRDLCELCGS
jgi:hypothetical protein